MFEVELKVRADHGRVRGRLSELGAERVGALVQTDTYYDAPDRSFAETDEALRIRRERPSDSEEERAVLTYKGPKVDETSKTREEVETPVDPDDMATVLDRLGYGAVATVRKEREVYALDDYRVTLDAVDGLGEFLEVETDVPEGEVGPAREGARESLRRLDLDPAGSIRESYLELLLSADGRPTGAGADG